MDLPFNPEGHFKGTEYFASLKLFRLFQQMLKNNFLVKIKSRVWLMFHYII